MTQLEPSITVILTAYKRPETLALQLNSIRAQSVQPTEIWLFQDAVPNDYKVVLDGQLTDQFDNVFIAKENIGVWGRFDFARSAQSEYVCIFDDDTIPGKQWLENCMNEMEKREGIYGTIGVILTDPSKYTQGGHFRIGWARPNEQTQEVDFVGHSWFLKREWLEYMFSEMSRYRSRYKYAAEDMSLSFACQKHGINTYVPPHPDQNHELWGSNPKTALQFGVNNVALSSGGSALMRNAAEELVHDGWNILLYRSPDYVTQALRNKVVFDRRKTWKRRISKINQFIIKEK